MVQIRLSGIEKSYGAVKVFEDLDLTIADKAYTCLLGPSGCGKSTLMRIISGLEDAGAGSIHFDDTQVDALTCAERDVGLAFQNYALYPHLTVEGNLCFPLRAPIRRGQLSAAEIDTRISEIADLLEITPYLHRSIDQLSGGQQQRVSLGRALIRHPKVLLLDEPITHLDARLRYAMRAELKRVHEAMGTTTIHVTHDQQEALAMADELVLMRDGRIEQVGAPMELYHRPNSSFAAGFLGDPPRSLITMKVVKDAQGVSAQLGGKDFPLPPHLVADIPALVGKSVTVLVPAHALRLEDESAALTGLVRAHEMIQGAQRIVLEVDGQRLNTHSQEVRSVANGDRVGVSLTLEQAQIFDGTTGQALTRRAQQTEGG